ncbi:hypothetical protein D3C78_1969680 [compost metagenome]
MSPLFAIARRVSGETGTVAGPVPEIAVEVVVLVQQRQAAVLDEALGVGLCAGYG